MKISLHGPQPLNRSSLGPLGSSGPDYRRQGDRGVNSLPRSPSPARSSAMAGWISSKLKVAETFLHQIDQQAAESLGKGERPQSPLVFGEEEAEEGLRRKPEQVPVPVKLQLPRKPIERAGSQDAGSRPARAFNSTDVSRASSSSTAPTAGPGSATTATASTDGDWTQLLSSSSNIGARASTSGISFPSPRSARRQGIPNRRSAGKSGREVEAVLARENEHAVSSDGKQEHQSSNRSEIAEDTSGSINNRLPSGSPGDIDLAKGEKKVEKSRLGTSSAAVSGNLVAADSPIPAEETAMAESTTDPKGKADAGSHDHCPAENLQESAAILRRSPSRSRRITEQSSGSSESDSGSSSSSDSEYESERKIERRKRRERVLAEKAAALAAEAIKERENLVARLEGERETLEKLVQERQKQQAQEASQLQSSMMETMDAVELEKQKHNSTRMEALAHLAELETRNAQLARSLASSQWDLQVEIDRVVELREMIESKELAQEDLRKRMKDVHLNASSDHKEEKRNEYERKLQEAEYHFICDKIGQMKEKVRTLESNIQTTKELAHPSQAEMELKKRLERLTDHLIQKQAQVESLSSEKATLQFRIETVSNLVAEEENEEGDGQRRQAVPAAAAPARVVDIEGGGGMAVAAMVSGERQVGSLLRQLDGVFAAGAVYLRKNPAARMCAWAYLLCLHLWVGYILTSAS